MDDKKYNVLSVRVPMEWRQELREYLAKRNISLQTYIIGLVNADMHKDDKKEG